MAFAAAEPVTPGARLLRLHVDEGGQVWYGHDGFLGENSRLTVDKFLGKHHLLGFQLSRVEAVRLLGVAGNATLIINLWQFYLRNKSLFANRLLWLASPAMCSTRAARERPAAVLQTLWQTPGLGGIYPMAEQDYSTYAVLASMQECRTPLDERTQRILAYHPTWPAFSFIPTGDRQAVARLVGLIVDPRWFRHPGRPARCSRLHRYLGLTEVNARAYFNVGPPGRNYERAKVVFDAWFPTNRIVNYDDPRNFLFRVFRQHDSSPYGLLAASRRLLVFVCQVWLNETHTGARDWGFQPRYFFKNDPEIKAYEAHRTTCRPV